MRLLWPLVAAACFLIILFPHSQGLRSLKFQHRFSSELSYYHDTENLSGNVNRISASSKLYNIHEQSLRFYHLLHKHDLYRLRFVYSTNQSLSFSSGNETINYGTEFGWLHYSVIDIGSPNTSFVVALDTGSDLLWVPCECKQCASTAEFSEALGIALNTYNPYASKTSKPVTCGSNLCLTPNKCINKSDTCSYTVEYVSDHTTTSGILYEDVIHLASGRNNNKSVEIEVTFGCGQVQTGDFLTGGAADGLLGLGLGEISLPSILAKKGLITNSFSMCFQADGSGRIFFGSRGTTLQYKTPFIVSGEKHVPYVVGMEQITVGSKTIMQKDLRIIIDSGTSFTYLPMDLYSSVTTEFDTHVQLERTVFEDIPLQFCYRIGGNNSSHPTISMVFQGGGNFSVINPVIFILTQNGAKLGFCLAVFPSDGIAILGQNFMTGYNLMFDRENMQLRWSSSDCYKLEDNDEASNATVPSIALPFTKSSSLFPPAPSQSNSAVEKSIANARVHHNIPLFYLLYFLLLHQYILSLWPI